MTSAVRVDGRSLSLADIERVALDRSITVTLDEDARERIATSRAVIERKVASGQRVYGVTTGFGRLADVAIDPEQRTALQHNLVRSHASGMGDPMDRPSVRALMLLRANALARGFSGCRVDVVERLIDFLNAGIHPRVPEFGSVGASGDLGPLAHVALGLLGEGEAESDSVEDEHGRRDQPIIVLEFLVGALLGMPRVPLDVARDEQHQDERRQNPERPIQVRVLRILRLEPPIEGY